MLPLADSTAAHGRDIVSHAQGGALVRGFGVFMRELRAMTGVYIEHVRCSMFDVHLRHLRCSMWARSAPSLIWSVNLAERPCSASFSLAKSNAFSAYLPRSSETCTRGAFC
jgi:hypothetical protein